MADATGDNRIFGRYTREECGLPPESAGRSGRRRMLLRGVALVFVLVAAGWAAGTGVARWREAWLSGLPAMVQSARPGDVSGLMAKGRFYAVALADRPAAGRNLGIAAMVAAENAKRRLGLYANAAALLAASDPLAEPATDFGAELAGAAVAAEIGEYAEAFTRLARADTLLEGEADETRKRSLRLLLVNTQAYLLATAPERSGRNPEKALHLAQLLVSSRDAAPGGGMASDSAAFMDTLACAWNAAGDAGRARATQRLALGMAEASGLDVYITHYDEFAADANR